MIGVWEVLAIAAFVVCYLSPPVIRWINPREQGEDGDVRIPLFNIKTRDRPVAIAMVVGVTAALTYWWSGAAMQGEMAAADRARLIAGDATLAAGFAVVATYTILEGVYGIMVFYSYLYDKLKAERRAAWEADAEAKGKAEGIEIGRAEGIEIGRAENAAALAEKDAVIAELKAAQAGRKNGNVGGGEGEAE